MEKRRASYDLGEVKAAFVNVNTLAITASAFSDALSLGYHRSSIAEVVAGIDRKSFYKSMTTFTDHRVWQDV